MKKIFLALIALMAVTFGVKAVDYNYTLVINLSDGSKVNYLFENTPVAMIEGDNLNITEVGANHTESVTYQIPDIVNMTFEKTPVTGVESIAAKGDISFGLTRDALEVFGLEGVAEITIYDTAGGLVVSAKSDNTGHAVLNIGNLGNGVYLVKAGNCSFKFIR